MSAVSLARVRVLNRTKGTVVASCAEVADSFGNRLVGLLGRRSLAPGGGLWLVPGNSIHTLGMRFPIDVVLLNREQAVVDVRKSVRPWSFVWPNFHARSILELPTGTIWATRTEPRDLLQIEVLDSPNRN